MKTEVYQEGGGRQGSSAPACVRRGGGSNHKKNTIELFGWKHALFAVCCAFIAGDTSLSEDLLALNGELANDAAAPFVRGTLLEVGECMGDGGGLHA